MQSLKAIEKAMGELRKKYNFKISILDDLLEAAGRSPEESNLELLKLLEMAEASPEITNFFTK